MRSRSTPEFRADVLRRHTASGLSLAEFCRREGLAYQSVVAWRSGLGRSPCPPAVASGFVDVECFGVPGARPSGVAPQLVAEVSLPGGACVRFFCPFPTPTPSLNS